MDLNDIYFTFMCDLLIQKSVKYVLKLFIKYIYIYIYIYMQKKERKCVHTYIKLKVRRNAILYPSSSNILFHFFLKIIIIIIIIIKHKRQGLKNLTAYSFFQWVHFIFCPRQTPNDFIMSSFLIIWIYEDLVFQIIAAKPRNRNFTIGISHE